MKMTKTVNKTFNV